MTTPTYYETFAKFHYEYYERLQIQTESGVGEHTARMEAAGQVISDLKAMGWPIVYINKLLGIIRKNPELTNAKNSLI